jgi:undecaprenyl-diphosphatase
MSHLTYLEAAVVGLIQGVSEMFPVSSLGHNILLPALLGGSWARDLSIAAPGSAYLAFIVGLHVATAVALLAYFWRDWLRIIRGFFSSLLHLRVETADQKLAWMIILATIPVGIAGVALQHAFEALFGHPLYAAAFLILNGLILLGGERLRRRSSLAADTVVARQRERAELVAAGRHASTTRAARQREQAATAIADRRLATVSYWQAILIGSAQILALFAGISRDGVTMVAGMRRGLAREDAARFAFLLATPAILAAGVLKVPDLLGPAGKGIHGPILAGSVIAAIGAYLSVRFLLRYLRTRTLVPFGIYCLVAGLASLAFLQLVR